MATYRSEETKDLEGDCLKEDWPSFLKPLTSLYHQWVKTSWTKTQIIINRFTNITNRSRNIWVSVRILDIILKLSMQFKWKDHRGFLKEIAVVCSLKIWIQIRRRLGLHRTSDISLIVKQNFRTFTTEDFMSFSELPNKFALPESHLFLVSVFCFAFSDKAFRSHLETQIPWRPWRLVDWLLALDLDQINAKHTALLIRLLTPQHLVLEIPGSKSLKPHCEPDYQKHTSSYTVNLYTKLMTLIQSRLGFKSMALTQVQTISSRPFPYVLVLSKACHILVFNL